MIGDIAEVERERLMAFRDVGEVEGCIQVGRLAGGDGTAVCGMGSNGREQEQHEKKNTPVHSASHWSMQLCGEFRPEEVSGTDCGRLLFWRGVLQSAV